MTYITSSFQEFISKLEGFKHLPTQEITHLCQQLKAWRYRIGQKIIGKETLPEQITILYEGKVRLLGYHPQTQTPTTLKLLQPGEIIGEISILREVACETAIASTEVICLSLSKTEYLRLLTSYPDFSNTRLNRSHLIEIFDILGSQVEKQANAITNLTELAEQAFSRAKIHYLHPGITSANQLDNENIWFISGGGSVTNFSPGSRLEFNDTLQIKGTNQARLIGLSPADLSFLDSHQIETSPSLAQPIITDDLEIPYASDEEIPLSQPSPQKSKQKHQTYPFVSGKGEINSISACFQMLSKHLKIPFRKEVIRRILTEQIKRQGNISFPACAYIAELIGLKSQLVDLPVAAITRIPTPALIYYGDSYAVLYETDANTIVAGVPSQGIVRCKPAEFVTQLDIEENNLPPQVKVLLLAATKETPQERFGIQWFIPYLSKHRRVLIEVFIASFFVQLAQLANPLVIQLIIDKVIVQNSISTLNVLG
ncbi:MAG: cyclic nucleotide-binding domain-containing protein, partial [Nodularia sp. (in: cyanobacteria)]|nr:cyclic nucleotide-binding domain-containing protein [Nodularia sp. (in: cyanobacteria)]